MIRLGDLKMDEYVRGCENCDCDSDVRTNGMWLCFECVEKLDIDLDV